MPTMPLPLPPAPEERAFCAFVQAIQADPDLRRVVKAWRVWKGEPSDTAGPSVGQCPWVGLTPAPQTSERLAIRGDGFHVTKRVVRVTILAAVEGTAVANAMRLYAAVANVFYHPDPTRRAKFDALMSAAGIMDVVEVQPAWCANDQDGAIRVAEGSVDLELYCDT